MIGVVLSAEVSAIAVSAGNILTSSLLLLSLLREREQYDLYRKKRGQSPTGILTHKAKASGLSSVSELLEVEGHDTFSYQKKKPKLVLNAPFQVFFL